MTYLFDFINPLIYSTIYYIVLLALCLMIVFKYGVSQDNSNVTRAMPVTQVIATMFTIIVILFIGLRPISGPAFIDMPLYAHTYNHFYDGSLGGTDDVRGEWIFYWFGNTCKKLGLIDREYFFAIAIIYFGLMAATCWRLMRNNMFVAILFCFISLSCLSYGTNGIRNGMASSIMMLAITFLNKERKWEIIISLILMYISINIHKSMSLTGLCAIVAFFLIKDTKYALFFWFASIVISAVAGNYVTEFFVDLGFDDRMEAYANLDEFGEVKESVNVKAGFRIDFILYSIMPIIMAWYVTIKRNFKDSMYNIIASTYILANAFWVMVIRSNQSNRFAYLSWFLYPIVIAYPLLRMNIWDDQDKKLAIILLLYSGFTFFMNFIYYG